MTTDSSMFLSPVAQRFRTFCGREQYDKFMQKLSEEKRLLFWQVQLWKRFLQVAALEASSDYDSVVSFFRLDEVQISLPNADGLLIVPKDNKTLVRSFRSLYTCNEQPVTPSSLLNDTGKSPRASSGITGPVNLGPHQHFVDFTVSVDWGGDIHKITVQDFSDTPLRLGCADSEHAVNQMLKFIQETSDTIKARICPDARFESLLNSIRIRIQNYTTGEVFSRQDEYSIACSHVAPCHAVIAGQISHGIVLLMNDLAAELSFGDALPQKRIEVPFP